MTLICTVGIPGAGKSTLRQLFQKEGGWATFSFDELDIPSRSDNERISIAIKLLIEEVLLKITKDGKPIRTKERLEYIITIDRYKAALLKKNNSFNGAIKELILSSDCVGVTESELMEYGYTLKKLEENIEKHVWIKSLQGVIDRKIKELKDESFDKYVFDLGARHIPELIEISRSGILSRGKSFRLLVVQIEADPVKVCERWLHEVETMNADDAERCAVYTRSNFRNKFIELSGVPLEGDIILRFKNALPLYDTFKDRFSDFVVKTLNDRKIGIDNLADNSEYNELIANGYVHIIKNTGTKDEFIKQFNDFIKTVIAI